MELHREADRAVDDDVVRSGRRDHLVPAGGHGADLVGCVVEGESQRTVLDDEPARIAARMRDFALWALAAWGVFFGFVLLPVRFLVRRRRAPG